MNTQTLRKKEKQNNTTQDLRQLFPKKKLHLYRWDLNLWLMHSRHDALLTELLRHLYKPKAKQSKASIST